MALTREDMEQLLDSKLQTLKEEMKVDMQTLKEEMKVDMQTLKEEMKVDMKALLRPLSDSLLSLKATLDIEIARAANSRASMSDALVKLPLSDGRFPVDFPASLGVLVVVGSELEVGGEANVSSWSAKRSLDLIKQYDSAYETDAEGTADERRVARSSRRRRLHLAKLIGVTPSQMAWVAQASFV
jgi:hypothetical protein